MSNSKEKAKELVDKMQYTQRGFVMPFIIAKQCALIAVDEILNCHIWKFNSVEPYKYWQEVKKQIELL